MRAATTGTFTRLASGAALAAALLAGCTEEDVKDDAGAARTKTEAAVDATGASAGAPTGAAPSSGGIPAMPQDLVYGPLTFDPPTREAHRLQLPNGLRIYFMPERGIPTLSVSARFTAGEVYLPKQKRGLARLAGTLLRSGGVEGVDARSLDRKLDALAASIETAIGEDEGKASLWTLEKNADEALALFAKVLRAPVFDEDRIRRAKDELKDEIAHRDDEPGDALEHEVEVTLYGDHPFAWRETEATVDGLTRSDLLQYHAHIFVPNNVILSVAGDFDRAAMEKKLEALFRDWKPAPLGLDMPQVDAAARPGVYLLDRPLNQGFVEIVEQGPALNDPDEMALQVMNYILGGGSFTSRITGSVRNEHGLAYSAYSRLELARKRPGTIGASFQSKAESAAFATRLCFEEIERMRTEPVSKDELERAKVSLRERFPERFATARGGAEALAEAEFDERAPDHFSTWRQRLDAVTVEDVQRVAQKHLRPGAFSVVVVGPRDVVLARDEKNKAALADHAQGGKVVELKDAE